MKHILLIRAKQKFDPYVLHVIKNLSFNPCKEMSHCKNQTKDIQSSAEFEGDTF